MVVPHESVQALPDDAGEPPDLAHLARYLPALLAEWDDRGEVRHRVIDGTVVFVDISGFTKLSERLAKHGKIGAEALTEAIDRCFVELLGIASGKGGQLIKFGGDALLLLFTGDHQAGRACQAALNMRRALRDVGRRPRPRSPGSAADVGRGAQR